jgi:hypothetical protein
MDLIARNQYRAWAAECKERAQQGHGFKTTYEWLKLANTWQRLADGAVNEAAYFQTDKLQASAPLHQLGLTATKR